ncbi:MAG: hypothetical protein ACW98K_03590 [Candidatus Kariarchaeaceae archaeon]|jgi:hypothetical protein
MNPRIKSGLLLGAGLWALAFFYAMIIMAIIGIDIQDEDVEFNIDHPDYWTFEAIMIPSFIFIGLIVFYYHYKNNPLSDEDWKMESLVFGSAVVSIQFILDLIFLVWLFEGGIEYFVAMVTISYLLIPLWAYLTAYYLKNK